MLNTIKSEEANYNNLSLTTKKCLFFVVCFYFATKYNTCNIGLINMYFKEITSLIWSYNGYVCNLAVSYFVIYVVLFNFCCILHGAVAYSDIVYNFQF